MEEQLALDREENRDDGDVRELANFRQRKPDKDQGEEADDDESES